MRRFLLTGMTFIGIGLAATPSMAREGLFDKSSDMPPGVTKAWDSVFAFLGKVKDGWTLGTFSLTGVKVEGQTTRVYFLGNRHVIAGSCPEKGKCRNANLYQEAAINAPPPFEWTIGSFFASFFSALKIDTSGLKFDNLEVVAVSDDADLALVRTDVSSGHFQLPQPLEMDPACAVHAKDKVFALGFSSTAERRDWKEGRPKDSEISRKRWSWGRMILRGWGNFNGGPRIVDASTLDSLHGGSGGPVLNTSGKLIGVVVGNSAGELGAYAGRESIRRPGFHTASVPCDYIAEILSSGLMK